jgi:hypothetical protein
MGYHARTLTSQTMNLVNSRRAARLAGLSTQQLREWTSRRELIRIDVKPRGRGSPAHYSWQTILLLRLAATLRDRFKIELQAHRQLFAALQKGLSHVSFLSLWGRTVVLTGGSAWSLCSSDEIALLSEDVIVLRLEPHLRLISEGFHLPLPDDGQYPLFPAVEVVGTVQSARVRQLKLPPPEVAV